MQMFTGFNERVYFSLAIISLPVSFYWIYFRWIDFQSAESVFFFINNPAYHLFGYLFLLASLLAAPIFIWKVTRLITKNQTNTLFAIFRMFVYVLVFAAAFSMITIFAAI